ncbi:hypothetical protein [Streptomyces sp. CdTB01]|uniref:hypothetical protein n=1 Tax=Streptomyces sp. CdTB01 TaxID=1725411 RepID=UPI00073A5C7F|nr:hypothetical protein [Streptomyces sp. CdTB01]ALV31501.1 hypothetical protein AS200_05125 [Streptomyces sp. CdTB01]
MHVPGLESRVLRLHPAPSEDAQLRRALAAQSAVHMAEGALAVLGPVPLAEARQVLVDLGSAVGMDVATVAEHLLNVVQGRGAPVAVTDGLDRALAPYRRNEPLV